MGDFDSAVLRDVTQLSLISGRLVRLLEDLAERLSAEREASSEMADRSRIVHADLLSAQELQKQMVAGQLALVNSMLRKQRRRRQMTVGRPRDTRVPRDQTRSGKPRRHPSETTVAQSHGQGGGKGASFTKRQRQIIRLVVLGYDNRQIGQSLCIAEQTVKNHLYTIFGKAGVSRRCDLAMHDTREADHNSLPNREFPVNEACTGPFAQT
jgi:ATP/maltotriose-dependent transcriptional regulator MalT